MTITEFLEARIAEDEAVTPADETWRAKWHTVDCGVGLGYRANNECTCDGPARVLAECAAKRAIIEVAKIQEGLWMEGQLLRSLAKVYEPHPDYRREWAK